MEEKKTFAEEVLDILIAHPNSELRIFYVDWGALRIQMRDQLKDGTPIGVQEIISHEWYDQSNTSIDEIMTFSMLHLRKELDNYGRKQ